MRDDLIADLFAFLGRRDGYEVGHPPSDVERRLEDLPLPLDVKRLLQWRWPLKRARVGPYILDSAVDLIQNDDLERLLRSRMIPVGIAPNGDLLVIRFAASNRNEIGLIFHDELWEEDASADVSFVLVAATVEELLYRAAEDRYLPSDANSASDLESLKSELRKTSGA